MSAHIAGTAARHILARDISPVGIGATIAPYTWCQQLRMNRECWHADARVVLAQGL